MFYQRGRFQISTGLTAMILLMGGVTVGHAQSYSSLSLVGVVNARLYGSAGIGALSQESKNDGTEAVATVNQSFTGLDQLGNTQTMNFVGTTRTTANYGVLRSYADGTVTNTYYNDANAGYFNANTGEWNTSGSPDGLASLGFAWFNDTLQFGGALQAGYKAKYYFHVDGSNSGYGCMADLGVNIAGHDESFFAVEDKSYNETWVTQAYDIDGSNPQAISVQFSDQFVLNTYDVADGTSASGISDFSSTLRLAGIEVVDQNGNHVDGVTFTSGSGTQYATVPEPASIGVLGLGIISLLFRRRRA